MLTLRRMVALSIATSLATLVLKFGAYWLTGSVSLWSDALETLVNLAAALVALAALTVAGRPADEGHAYGHDKAEYFSSGVEGTLILVAGGSIIYVAIHHFLKPQPLTELGPGIIVSLVATAMNYATARTMLKVARREDSITIEADARHLLADVWTSLGIVVGLGIVIVAPRWAVLDPVMAVAVGVHVLWTAVALLQRSVDGLMDAALPASEIERATAVIRAELPPNASFHALRTRKAGSRRFIEFHLLVPSVIQVGEAHALCDRIEVALSSHLARASITIHVEPLETHGTDTY